jgi:hypothetical protein
MAAKTLYGSFSESRKSHIAPRILKISHSVSALRRAFPSYPVFRLRVKGDAYEMTGKEIMA